MSTEISLSCADGSILTGGDALLHRYEICLFTSPGEFEGEPQFGMGLGDYVSEPNNDLTARAISAVISTKTEELFPEIRILSLRVTRPQLNQITVELVVQLIPYNQTATINKTIGE